MSPHARLDVVRRLRLQGEIGTRAPGRGANPLVHGRQAETVADSPEQGGGLGQTVIKAEVKGILVVRLVERLTLGRGEVAVVRGVRVIAVARCHIIVLEPHPQ